MRGREEGVGEEQERRKIKAEGKEPTARKGQG
jgi:hypothetical protein